MTGAHFCPMCIGLDTWLRQQIGPHVTGCMKCDFTGTRTGYDRQEKRWKEDMGLYENQRAEYLRNGVCSGCGAKCLKEAREMCKPRSLGETGDYYCDGEDLWEDQRDAEDEEGQP